MSNQITVIVETMPEHLRASHRAAGNWGSHPQNGSIRRRVPLEEAEEIAQDEEYDHIVEGTAREEHPELATIEKLAPQVAEQSAELDAAIDAERSAEAAVLERAIDLARPALRAISSRVVRKNHDTNGHDGCHRVEIVEHFERRGITLHLDVDRVLDETGNSGHYSGNKLVLWSDGTLSRLEASGSWSIWQGSWDRLDYESRTVTPREAMNEYELSGLLESLAEALRRQLKGKAPEKAKAARARAAKLEAILGLVK